MRSILITIGVIQKDPDHLLGVGNVTLQYAGVTYTGDVTYAGYFS